MKGEFTGTGNGPEVILSGSKAKSWSTFGPFVGTAVLQVQPDTDLNRTIAEDEWVDVKTVTEPQTEVLIDETTRRWRFKCPALTSGPLGWALNES